MVEEVSLPVLGSGDVTGPESARRMLERTGCAGLMIGRAALGNPWIFGQVKAYLNGGEVRPPKLVEIQAAMARHLFLLTDHYGEEPARRIFKGWAGRYLKGLPSAKSCREAIHRSGSLEEIRTVLIDYFEQRSGLDRWTGPSGGLS